MANVLVTGATGTIGRQLVQALRRHPALSIHVGLRDPAKAPEGTRGVRLDWADPATFAPAVAGVERLFLLTPFVEQFEGPSRAMLEAAAAAGVKFIVKLSAMGLTEDVPFDSGRQHARLEKALMGGPIPGALLKPTFFMDNVLTYQRQVILDQGAFYGASGGQCTTYVSSRDVGAAGAAMIADPARFAGRAVELTGPAAIADAEIARLLGQKLGREVRFVDLTLDQYAGALKSQGTPGWQVEALVGLEAIKRNGWASTPNSGVADTLGRPAESFADFLAGRGADLS
jgi:uncharacterized protein YbjT (DUF2867 family)